MYSRILASLHPYILTSLLMEIIKAFTTNSLTQNVTIIMHNDKPLFKANDIGTILDMKNIRNSISNFNESEKILKEFESKGGKQITIFLTEKGLEKLLSRSRKPKSALFRDWIYLTFKEFHPKQKKELEEQVKKQAEELKNVQSKLEIREKKKFIRGETVYIYEDVITNTNDKVYKVGYSGNMNSRLSSYESNRFDDNLKYTINCCNGRLLESVMHHLLRSYVDQNKKEWFHTTFEIVKATLETAQNFLDNLVNIDAEHDIIKNLENITKCITNNKSDEKTKEGDINSPSPDPLKKGKLAKPATSDEIQVKIAKFIEECCILDENAVEKTHLIGARYRLWAKRHTALQEGVALTKYLDDNFAKTRKWNEQTKTAQLSVKGIRINDDPYYISNNPPNEYDRFIQEMCILSPGARAPLCYIVDDFIKWKTDNKVPLLHRKKEHVQLYRYFVKYFVPVNGYFIFHGKKESGGLYGITIKSNPDIEMCHSSQSETKRKKVYKIDPKTKEIVEIYNSLTEMGHIINGDSHYILHKNAPYKGFLYTYNPPSKTSECATNQCS